MAVNLLRNARVFYTTNVNEITGVIKDSGFATSNTFELTVQDNFSFTQNTAQDTITLNEAGSAPVRGQVAFNTALEPVDWSFSMYLKPAVINATSDAVVCEEMYLWHSLFSNQAIETAEASGGSWISASATSTAKSTKSNVHQLYKFGLIVVLGDMGYLIDNCAVESATVDFGLDAIASVTFAGKGTNLRANEGLAVSGGTTGNRGDVTVTNGSFTGSNVFAGRIVDAGKYITNKLSVVKLFRGIGDTTSTNEYSIPLTGGSITIANNLTYLTPANLGVVNTPCTYFTGTRAISGSMTAYLRRDASANKTGELLQWFLDNKGSIQQGWNLNIKVGGSTSPYVEFDMPAAMLTVPTVEVQPILSTTINFTAMGYTATAFDVEQPNELTVKYHHPVVAP